MTISRNKAAFLYRRLANAEDVIVASLANPPKAKVVDEEEYVDTDEGEKVYTVPTAYVDTQISLNVVKRAHLHDLKTMIEEVLKECAGDQDFD